MDWCEKNDIKSENFPIWADRVRKPKVVEVEEVEEVKEVEEDEEVEEVEEEDEEYY